MIVRSWTGRTRAEDVEAYLDYLRRTGLDAFASTPGNRGSEVHCLRDGETAEFVVVSYWDSMDAVRRFAGEEPGRAVFYPEDDVYLVERELGVRHHEVLERSPGPSAGILLRTLREMYAGPAWHGPSLRGVLRGLTHEEAQRRAGPGRNSIWELVLHLAGARHLVVGRLSRAAGGAGAGRFPRRFRKRWWPSLPESLTAETWEADLDLLDRCQERLLEAVEDAPEATLALRRKGQPRTLADEVLGVALHDAYHAGQIRLVRLLEPAETRGVEVRMRPPAGA